MSVIASEAKQSPHRRTSRSTSYPPTSSRCSSGKVPEGGRVSPQGEESATGFSLWFGFSRFVPRIESLSSYLIYERTSYVSRSSFVSQVRIVSCHSVWSNQSPPYRRDASRDGFHLPFFILHRQLSIVGRLPPVLYSLFSTLFSFYSLLHRIVTQFSRILV